MAKPLAEHTGVAFLSKLKIHELAKELNVTSRRLMEKLEEIGIHPKSHMSTLNNDELERLYKHIGIVDRTQKKDEQDSKKDAGKSSRPEKVAKRDIPRIIRKTEVVVRDDYILDEQKEKKKERRSYVRSSDSNDGLMAGFTRSNDSVIAAIRKRPKKEEPKPEPEDKKQEPIDILDSIVVTDRIKKPVDDILSIKKVARVSDLAEKPEDKQSAAKEEESGQKEKAEAETKKEEAKATRKAAKAEDKEKQEPKPEVETEKAKSKKEESSAEKTAGQPAGAAAARGTRRKGTAAEAADSADKGESRKPAGAENSAAAISDDALKRPRGSRLPRGEKRTSADRGPGGRPAGRAQGDRRSDRRSDQLVIPKVPVPGGQVEEKVFTRGERREMQAVEKRKEERKELRREAVKPTAMSQKGRMRKKIDIVVHKASVSDMMSDDFVINTFYDDASEAKNVKRAERRLKKAKIKKEKYIPPKAVLTVITIPETITVKDLAEALKKTVADVIKRLFLMGIAVTQNEELDFDTAAIVADEYGVKAHKAVVVSEEDILFDDSEDDEEDLEPRAPVVVVMGHVDHGKTSLLDAIRSANIAEHEAGGITQRIGAYTVNLNGRDITFLDTPGHEAFTAMRARGAQVTDIAILVVAADDGVMPQTVEAINHAKAAGVSIIVAINKIDRPNANPDKVKQELAEHGLLIEEWGGDVIAVPVSAKKRENIDQLLEMVLLTSDILELKANPKKQAKGTVIEATLDKNRGPVATLLVQRGTLKVGDFVLSGSAYGHIRSMVSDKGKKIKEAGPSVPVEVFGLSEVPEAGDLFYAVTDEKVAKQLAEKRKDQAREKSIKSRGRVSLEDLFSQIQEGQVKELNLIVKADVQGSVEAVKQSMEKLSNEEVKVKVIHGAVGAIAESDVALADVSNAIIIGFNVRPGPNVMEVAQAAGVDLRLYRVIYDAIEDMENAMKGMLKPTYKEVVDGHVEIRQLFKVSSLGTIGGAYVLDGKITRNSDVRLVRDGIVVYEGKLASLKRFKDDVREVTAGYECGLMIEKFNDIKEGDIIEAYHMEEIQR
jgi:translation initiation factor IF-2